MQEQAPAQMLHHHPHDMHDSEAAAGPADSSVKLQVKQCYKEKHVRGHLPSWESEFGRFIEENVMSCVTCRQYPHLSDPASTLVKGIAGHK